MLVKNQNPINHLEFNIALVTSYGAFAVHSQFNIFDVVALDDQLGDGGVGVHAAVQILDDVAEAHLVVTRGHLTFDVQTVAKFLRLVDVGEGQADEHLLDVGQTNFKTELVVTVQVLGAKFTLSGDSVDAVLDVDGKSKLTAKSMSFRNIHMEF